MGKDGYGEHAECSAIRRCNRNRLGGSSIVVVARRKRNSKVTVAFPCEDCFRRITKVGIKVVIIQDKLSNWVKIKL